MDGWLKLTLLGLACCRLAQLFAYDEGPFSVFHRIRMAAGAYDYNERGEAKTAMGRMMTCPYCLGMWMALPLAIYADLSLWWLWWLAIAGLQSFLQGLVEHVG